ncbi:DUF2332 domain-containing protein [Mycobacterium sp. pUA109]|uniref:DUF2332 domain-containing protein n=1 Tax=Mycobacterium sp. pUA109 TaxID=3238982 RepID=UPI00351AD089
MSPAHLSDTFAAQARACTALGSPMYGQLLTRIVDDVAAGGVFAEVLAGHETDPGPSALALRLLGGLHRLVLDGSAPALRRWYPSVGGTWDTAAAWPEVVAAARDRITALRTALGQPPQTNEVGRSAALIGGLLLLARRFPLPVRLFEIGASAGLNLRADHYRYRFSGGGWGPTDSAVVIEDAWRGQRPPETPLRIVARHGFDIAPMDVTRADDRLTLLSYVWPDMPVRVQRLRGALEIARRVPARLERASAAEAVRGLHLTQGSLTVLWHSVTWQYLTAGEQTQVTAAVRALGARAGADAPLAWLSLEPRRRARKSAHEFLVQARCWPEGSDEILGVSAPHGPPVRWE